MDREEPAFDVQFLAGMPIEQRVLDLEGIESTKAYDQLKTIWLKIGELADDPILDGIHILTCTVGDLYVSFYGDAKFYYIVRGHQVYPIGALFDDDRSIHAKIIALQNPNLRALCEKFLQGLRDEDVSWHDADTLVTATHARVSRELAKISDRGATLSDQQRRTFIYNINVEAEERRAKNVGKKRDDRLMGVQRTCPNFCV